MKIIYTLIIILLSCPAISQPFSETEKSILEAQDKRDASALIKIIESGTINTDSLYLKAIIALANVADTSTKFVDQITKLYGRIQEPPHNRQGNPIVRSAAAFALGQIPCSYSVALLGGIEELERSEYSYNRTPILISTLNALGKIGNEKDLERICEYEFKNDSLNGALALSIAKFGMRKIKCMAAFEKLKKLTYSIEDETQREWVAYAYNRIADKDLINNSRNELEFLSTSQNIYCKMWAFSALGKTADPNYAEFLMKWYPIETDWRVKVNMLNAIGNLEINENSLTENHFNLILNSAVDDANPNVSLTACQVLAKICSKLGKSNVYSTKLRENFEHYLAPERAVDSYIQNEMILTLAKVFKDDYKPSLFSLFSQAEGYDRKSAIVSAFQYMDDPLVYKELRDSISADVKRYNKLHPNTDGSLIGSPDLAKMYLAFVHVLDALDDRMEEKDRNIIRLIFSEFSSSKNTAITDVCISALMDSTYSKYWEETGQVMAFDFANFNEKSDRDAILLFIDAWGKMKTEAAKETLEKKLKSSDYDIAKASADALKQITGKDYIKNITASKFTYDWDWNYINNLGSKKIAQINTEKGVIKIELFPEIAPFTVQSFVKLGEKGFYNGTIFHRVVPNFVIQGGDPTGSGYGGPGYSIRTEIAENTFDAYYVGMASSGKDTEGSQFFITLSPQPHLDGKYTIFGKVIEGFDVVDKIVIGDEILNITFSSN